MVHTLSPSILKLTFVGFDIIIKPYQDEKVKNFWYTIWNIKFDTLLIIKEKGDCSPFFVIAKTGKAKKTVCLSFTYMYKDTNKYFWMLLDVELADCTKMNVISYNLIILHVIFIMSWIFIIILQNIKQTTTHKTIFCVVFLKEIWKN